MDELLATVREPLGVSDAADVKITLKEARLLLPGAALTSTSEREHRADVFACLVLPLPSIFRGGEVAFGGAQDKEVRWSPGALNPYDLHYAAFHTDCNYIARHLSSGNTLALVYDLATTTPNEIPRFAGTSATHRVVNSSLLAFFGPSSQRHLAYITSCGENDSAVARSLARFCAKTKRKYVLSTASTTYVHVADPDHDGCTDAELTVTLRGPWKQNGAIESVDYGRIDVDFTEEVAPAGCLEEIEFDESETEDISYGMSERTRMFWTEALVVMPASVPRSERALSRPSKRARN